jgi:hypothetical protein
VYEALDVGVVRVHHDVGDRMKSGGIEHLSRDDERIAGLIRGRDSRLR